MRTFKPEGFRSYLDKGFYGFVEFSSSGFYFDEVKGDISASQLNLYALSDITDISTVNINLMTHLEKRRVAWKKVILVDF